MRRLNEAYFLQIRNGRHGKDLYLGGPHRVLLHFSLLVDVKPKATTKQKIGRREDLSPAASKENTGDLFQSSLSPNSNIGTESKLQLIKVMRVRKGQHHHPLDSN